MNANDVAKFYKFFRKSFFFFLEKRTYMIPPSSIMQGYYEYIHQHNYPWVMACGFWNVFLRLEFSCDMYDRLLSFTIVRSLNPSASPRKAEGDAFSLSDILSAYTENWRKPVVGFSMPEIREVTSIYANSIEPFAAQIFIPARAPNGEAEDFGWRPFVTSIQERMRVQRKT